MLFVVSNSLWYIYMPSVIIQYIQWILLVGAESILPFFVFSGSAAMQSLGCWTQSIYLPTYRSLCLSTWSFRSFKCFVGIELKISSKRICHFGHTHSCHCSQSPLQSANQLVLHCGLVKLLICCPLGVEWLSFGIQDFAFQTLASSW